MGGGDFEDEDEDGDESRPDGYPVVINGKTEYVDDNAIKIFSMISGAEPLSRLLMGMTTSGAGVGMDFLQRYTDHINLSNVSTEANRIAELQGRGTRDAAREIAEQNMDLLPMLNRTTSGEVIRVAGELDADSAEAFTRSLDNIWPSWREEASSTIQAARNVQRASNVATPMTEAAAADVAQNAQLANMRARQAMTEGLPADLAAKIEQRVSESSAASGLFGPAAISKSVYQRALGEWNMVKEGVTMSGQAAELYERSAGLSSTAINMAGAPITANANAQNVMMQFMPPTVDRASLFNSMSGAMYQGALTSPSAALQTQAGLYGGMTDAGVGVAGSNQQLDLARVVSALGLGSEMASGALAATVNRYAISKSQPPSMTGWSFIQPILGAFASGVGSKYSDASLKKNVERNDAGLPEILALPTYRFEYVSDQYGRPGKHLGVMAQELEKLMPEAVGQTPEGHKFVDYSQVVTVLVKAVQDLSARVAELQRGA